MSQTTGPKWNALLTLIPRLHSVLNNYRARSSQSGVEYVTGSSAPGQTSKDVGALDVWPHAGPDLGTMAAKC